MIHSLLRPRFSLFAFVLCVPALFSQTTPEESSVPVIPAGANLSDPGVLLPLAVAANNLDDQRLTPWHLKASYESFDEKGKLADTGIFEEWQLSPEKWKRTYNSSRFNQTEYASAEGRSYETDAGAPSWPLSLIAKEFIHPMPRSTDTGDSKPELTPFTLGAIKLNCVILARPLQRIRSPFGTFPTYCFNPSSTMLRFHTFDSGIQAARNQMATFRGAYVAKNIALNDDDKPLLRGKLISLSSMTENEVGLIIQEASTHPASSNQMDVDASVMTGNKLRGSTPTYPEEAKRSRIQGRVVLEAVIGADGRIQHLRVLSSPDKLLSNASVAAVERWVYKPYTLQGQPISVLTTINVVFRLGV